MWNRRRKSEDNNNCLHRAGDFSEGISEGSGKKANQEHSTLGLEAVEADGNSEKGIMCNTDY